MKIKVKSVPVTGRAVNYNQAVFVIYESANGRDDWKPLKPAEVPEWVSHHDVLGRLVNGDMAMDPRIGDGGSPWYRADVFLAPAERTRLESALAQRDSREARRILKLH